MKKFIVIALLLALYTNLWAFGNLTPALQEVMQKHGYNKYFTTVSLLFENKNINDQINVIELKKTIALDLQKNFQVADPIFSAEFAKRKSLSRDDFLQKEKSSQFFELTNSKILIFTNIIEKEQRIFTLHNIFSKEGVLLKGINQSFQREPFLQAKNVHQAKATNLIKKNTNKEPLFASASVEYFSQNDLSDFETNNLGSNDFFSPIYRPFLKENANWLFYQPTAFFMPGNFLQINFDLQDIELVQGGLNNINYIVSTENFELSLYGTGYRGKLDYSYLRVKTKFYYQQTAEPVFTLSGGLRARVYRNEQEMQSELNNERENLSFFLVASGYLGQFNSSMYNFYLDNYFFGAGYKLFLSKKINLFFDTNQDYRSEQRARYLALGLEHAPTESIGYILGFNRVNKKELSASSQNESGRDRLNIGIKFSW